MQKALSVLALVGAMSVTSVFAADLPGVTSAAPTVTATPTSTSPDVGPMPSSVAPATSATVTPTQDLTAAPTVAPSMGSALGEYKSVACTSNPAFATNSCDQCFVGSSIKVGGDLSGLFDNWNNNTTGMLIAYKDEQKTPNMVPFGTTTWTNTPTDLTKFWKNSSDVTWVSTGSGGRQNYILQPGQKVKFYEAELGARYVLEKTDKKNGDVVGMLRFPVVAHAVDKTTGTEGTANTHYECVTYTLSAPTVTPAPTPTPTPPAPKPSEVTQTQTGPAETLVLILAAFFIAFGMMFSLRKRI